MLTLWRRKFFIKSSMTSKVIQGHKQWPFYLKITFSSVCVIDWLKKQMRLNIMKGQSLTYVLMDNFLSFFLLRIRIRPQVETNDTLVENLFWEELVYCSVGSEAWTYLSVLSTNRLIEYLYLRNIIILS